MQMVDKCVWHVCRATFKMPYIYDSSYSNNFIRNVWMIPHYITHIFTFYLAKLLGNITFECSRIFLFFCQGYMISLWRILCGFAFGINSYVYFPKRCTLTRFILYAFTCQEVSLYSVKYSLFPYDMPQQYSPLYCCEFCTYILLCQVDMYIQKPHIKGVLAMYNKDNYRKFCNMLFHIYFWPIKHVYLL